MTSSRKTALVVGVLFILTFITSIAGVFAYGPVLTDPHYVTGAGADTGVFVGAFLELFLIITNIGCAVVLFPLLKKQNEAIALGYVAARIVECTFILVGILSVLAVVTLRQHADQRATPARSSRSARHSSRSRTGRSCSAPASPTASAPDCMLGWLMYRSGLVHRRMALFGVIGGPLLAASGLAVLLGVIPQGSPVQSVMTVPEIVWEAYLGLWLTFKGFNAAAPILGLVRREDRDPPRGDRGGGDRAGLRRRGLTERPQEPGSRGLFARLDVDSNPRRTGQGKGSRPCPTLRSAPGSRAIRHVDRFHASHSGPSGRRTALLTDLAAGGSASPGRRPAASSGCCGSRPPGDDPARRVSRSSATSRMARTSSPWP